MMQRYSPPQPTYGTPTNFHNREYYPGGSSSGTASAVAAGIVPFGVGTDAGMSPILPLFDLP